MLPYPGLLHAVVPARIDVSPALALLPVAVVAAVLLAVAVAFVVSFRRKNAD